MNEVMYRYNHIRVGDDGELVTSVDTVTGQELKARHWENWATARTMLGMPTNECDFISDLGMIFQLEEV